MSASGKTADVKEESKVVLDKIGNILKNYEDHLIKIEGVEDIHHIHIWSIDGFHNYVTLHVVTNSNDFKKLKNIVVSEMK